MTERKWLASKDPDAMISFLETHLPLEENDEDLFLWPAIRKLRLFAVACCRHIEHLLTDRRSRSALDVMERYLDRRATKKQLRRAVESSAKVTWDLANVAGGVYHAACAACSTLEDIQDDFIDVAEVVENACRAVTMAIPENQREKRASKVQKAEMAFQADLLREIFGNPFRPVMLDPSWLTSDVLALTRGIYDEKAFDRLPILADALQDAGCDNEAVLNHCRDTKQVHVRGCWVLDTLLGKS